MPDHASKSSPPESWKRILVLFTLAGFVEAMFYGQVGSFTPLFLPKLGVAPEQVAYFTGLIVAVSGLAGIPFLPFWGALADRYSRQPVIIRSYVAHFIAAVIAVLAGNVWVFLITRLVMNLSLGNSGLMMTTLSERAPANRQGLSFSIMNSAAPVGVFVGPLIGGPIVDLWGFRALMAIDAVLMLVVILTLSVSYKDTYRSNLQQPLTSMAVDSLRIIARSPRLRTLFPALTILFGGWMLAFTYVPLAVTALYSGPNEGRVVGLVMGIGGLLALLLSPILGALADRYGLWRVLLVSAIIEVALWPLPALVEGLLGLGVTWTILNGVASAVFALSFSLLAQSASQETRGRVMSFSYLPVNIGSILGPAIGSFITRGSVFTVFPVAAVLTALGIIALWYANRQEMR
jgi:DHA1 family multidrug resistance protein-like MFS transporter